MALMETPARRRGRTVKPRTKLLLKIALPLVTAWAALQLEPYLSALAHDRPAVLPAAMFTLIVCVLIARTRQALLITISFGVGMLAVREAFGPIRLPAEIDYREIELLYPFVWGAIAVFAMGAGVAEARHAGSIWARRCYFAAAALFLLGKGTLTLAQRPSIQAAVLVLSGLFSVYGVVYAHRIVARERMEEPVEEDLQAMREAPAARSAALAAKEWREPSERGATNPRQAGAS